VGSLRVDLTKSLDPFVAIYAADGTVVASDGALDGAAPAPPTGVLDAARQKGVDRVTWQPRAGVRVATVVLRWSGGTVLAGRSLRRVEEIESSIEGLLGLGWVGLIATVAMASAIAARLWPRARDRSE
jgi:hypothetical protein